MPFHRRDVIKKLMAVSALGTTGILSTPASLAARPGNAGQLSMPRYTQRGDANYEVLRNALTWKPNIPARYPEVIVQAGTEAAISEALAFAEKQGLKVVTRCSGHNIDSLRDGGMMLDLSGMMDFSIDSEGMQASVQPALSSWYFYEHLARQGLIYPLPDCHSVALGGYLLGGGHACLGDYWGGGPACYSIVAADVILADGKKVRASNTENLDLFWAMRGIGPGFFGVVTRFQLKLYPQPATFMQSTWQYDPKAAEAVLDTLEALNARKHRQTQLTLTFEKGPGRSSGTLRLTVRALADNDTEAQGLLAPYGEIAAASILSREEYRTMDYRDFMYNPGRSERNLSDNIWTDERNVLVSAIEHCRTLPADSYFITTLYSDRGAPPPRDDACYSPRGSHFMSHHLIWKDAGEDLLNRRWYEALCPILWSHASSYYVNQMEGTLQGERVKACFSTENWQRLEKLRDRYDPGRRFFSHMR